MKNATLKTILKTTGAVALCLVADCTKLEQNTAAPGADIIPSHLQFGTPPITPDLTKAQADLVKKAFTVTSTMVLPPGELIFPDKNMSPAELAKEEADLKKQDPNSFALLQDIRRGCKKGHPNLKIDATFPTENQIVESDLLVGDKMTGSISAGLVGQDCPVDYSGGIGASAEVTAKNDQTKEIAAKAGYNIKMTAVMKNPKYAKLLGLKGMIVDASVSGLAARRDVVVGKYDRGLVTFKLKGSYLSLDREVPYEMIIKDLLESDPSKKTTSSEAAVYAKLRMPGFIINLVVHQNMQNDVIISKDYFLNGHPKTEAELNDLFGNKIPGSDIQNNAVIQTLQ